MSKNHSRMGLILAAVSLAGFVGAAWAADDTVTITFTTLSATGKYSPSNVHVVYLADSAGRFVTTVGSGTGTKRALWGNARAHDLTQWFGGNSASQADINARTGATQTAYKTYTVSWNWAKLDGSTVPDGTYKLRFELTDDNSDKNKFNRAEFTITKGRSPWRLGPTTSGGYKDVVIQYTPAAVPQVVCDPNAIDFGTVAVGATKDGSLSVRNPGTVAVTITAMQIAGQDKAAYSLTASPTMPLGLAPGGSAAVTIQFAPQAAGTYRDARLEVTATGLSAPSQTTLTGKAAAMPATIQVSTDHLAFAPTRPGESATATLSIGNSGPGVLQVQSMTLTGPDADRFQLVGWSGKALTLVPGQQAASVEVRFTAATYKTCHAGLAIASNDPNHPVVSVGLDAEAAALGVETLQILYGLGSQCSAIAMVDTQALIGQGMVLSQYFVADRCGPFPVASAVLPGVIEDLVVEGDTAYASLGNAGFAVVHVQEVNAPTVVVAVDTPGFCRGLSRVADRLCVADGQAGLLVYDVSVPPAARLTGSLAGDIVAVAALADKTVCLDSQAGLLVVDPCHAVVLGQQAQLRMGRAVVTSGTLAYMVDRLGRFFVVDLADIASPRVTGSTQLAGPGQALAVTGTSVAVAAGAAGMQLVDVSDPAHPVACESIPLAGDCTDVTVNALGVYLVDRQLGLYDYKLPSGCQITRRRALSLGSTPLDVAADAAAAYLAAGPYGLHIWNTTDAAAPKFLGSVEGDVQAVAVAAQAAYLACGSSGLRVLDVSTPTSPRPLAGLDLGGPAHTLACAGATLFAGTDSSVKIIDVADPCSPALRASWSSQGHILGLASAQGLGLAACGDKGLAIFDSNGITRSTLDTPGVAYGIEIAGSVAYVADGPAGVQVIDVRDSRAPAWVATLSTPGPAYAVAAEGQDLYVAGRFGIWRFDITAPLGPTLSGTSSVPGSGVSLAVGPSALFVADPKAGFLVLHR